MRTHRIVLWSALFACVTGGGALAVTALALTAHGESPARTEIRDDFSSYADDSDGAPTWVPHLGHWVMRDGRCEQTDIATVSAYLFLAQPALRDLEFSVRFNVAAKGNGVCAPGMAFRAVDGLGCYYATFDAKNSQVLLIRRTREKPWQVLARVRGVPIERDAWHTGRVVCDGPNLKVYFNDKLIAEATDGTFPSGRIGLRSGQAHVRFDDLSVDAVVSAVQPNFETFDEPHDESSVPRAEVAEDRPILRGGGYFPVLVELKDGSLGAVIRNGAAHLGVGGRLDWIRSTNGGKTWSKPKPIVDSEWDDRNQAVGVMKNGTIVVAYCELNSYTPSGGWDPKRGKYALYFVTSKDRGRTWSKKKKLCPDLLYSGSPYGRILVLDDGTSLMNVYTFEGKPAAPGERPTKAPNVSGLLRSTDNGQTWGDWSDVATGCNETSIVAMPDGRLVAALRLENGGGTAVCASSDKGRTWSPVERVTKPEQHPAELLRLDSGALVMLYGSRRVPMGIQALLSDDAGRTWNPSRRAAVAWSSLTWDSGYPSAVQRDDGTIVMLYYAVGTIDDGGAHCRQVRFTEERLREAMPPRDR